jgi:hypothetical protein
MTIGRPDADEFAPFYAAYIGRVTEPDVRTVLEAQASELRALAAGIRRDHELFRYEPGKWSVRQTFGHLIDTERVMGYRAFSIGRGEVKPLPGFDQNDYVARARSEERSVADLADEFASARAANLWPIRDWTDVDAARMGNANGHPVSARAIAYIMAGHVRHHVAILRDRYKVDG